MDNQQAPRTAAEQLVRQRNEYAKYLEDEEERLLDVADSLTSSAKENPIKIISHLLEFWLLNGGLGMNSEKDKAILSGALATIRALHEVESAVQGIHFYYGELNRIEREVRGE